MAGMISTLIAFIIALAVILGILCSVIGEPKGNTILVNCITAAILYSLIIYMFSVDGSGGIFNSSVPLIEAVEKYGSVKELILFAPGEFSLCFVELTTVVLIISILANTFKFEKAGFVNTLITKGIIVFAGLLVYGFVMDSIRDNIIIKYCVYALETLLAGGSIAYTPIMIGSMITGLKTDNFILVYVMQQLPKTSLGRAISVATTSSVLLILMMLVLENQYGSVTNVLQGAVAVFQSGGSIIVMAIGIYMAVKSLRKL